MQNIKIKRHIQSLQILLGGIVLTALFLFLFFFFYKIWILKSDVASRLYPNEIVSDINSRRMSAGLNALAYDDELSKAATKKAEDMAARGYFSHNGPDGSTPWQFMESEGYDFLYAGENLGVDFFDVEDLDNAWMNSPGHRANIMSPDFTETGIGVATGHYEGRNVVFFVQMFGKPYTNDELLTYGGGGKVLGASTEKVEKVRDRGTLNLNSVLANPTVVLKYSYIILSSIALFVIITIFLLSDRLRSALKTLSYSMGAVLMIWILFYIYTGISFAA